MFRTLARPLALLTLIALSACTGGGRSNVIPPGVVLPAGGGLTQQNFVGIGDSLTFGWQSGGGLGASVTGNPVSAYPAGTVPVTQTMGWWAMMYAQKNGIAMDTTAPSWNLDTMLGTATSPLPLIAPPGLGSQLVLSTSSPGFRPSHSPCDGFNLSAYSPNSWASTRVAPGGPIADLAVPGMTMHEAVAMTQPLTGPPNAGCGYTPIASDPTAGNLQSLVQGESQLYYPVLGQFQTTLGPGRATELAAAASLHPQLVTVWLGANDLLKYIFSHGQSPATDSPSQFAADLTQIITTLEAGGAKVVVANLPDILGNPGTGEIPVPQFFPQTKISADLQALGFPAALANADAAYISANYTQGNGGFLTESGFFAVAQQASPTPQLDPSGAGSGDGSLYLDQTFAATAIALNNGYNLAIGQVAAGTGAGLADINTQFKAIAAGGVPVAPGVTLTLQFGGGILSFDGLHPANAGYALIANAFIGAADTKFSLSIPPLSNAQFAQIVQNDPYDPFLIKSLNPAWPYPLP